MIMHRIQYKAHFDYNEGLTLRFDYRYQKKKCVLKNCSICSQKVLLV